MPTYTCSDCDKSFINKSIYIKHITRKFPCKKKDDDSSCNDSIYNDFENLQNFAKNLQNLQESAKNSNSMQEHQLMCNYCLKVYSDKYVLHRHIKSFCKTKKQEDNKKEEIYQKLLKENEELKKEREEFRKEREEFKKELDEVKNEIKQMKTSGNKIINNNSNNCNIHNGDVNNIVIVAHGREDLEKIDVKYILEALKRGTSAIPVITERIHFNVKYPEYQNVYITNMNQKYGMIYDGKEWKLKDKDTIIEDLYEKKFDFLDENFENIYNQLSESQQKAFKRFLDIHEKADTDKQSKKIIDKIKRDLKFLLYNNKKIPIDNYNCITIN